MTTVWDAAGNYYKNITTNPVRLGLVVFGAYLLMGTGADKPTLTPTKITNPTITIYSNIGAIGITTQDIKQGSEVIGSRDQFIIEYKVTGPTAMRSTININGKKVMHLDHGDNTPVSFTIPKSTVISAMGTSGDLQVEIRVVPASNQAGATKMSFRYLGA